MADTIHFKIRRQDRPDSSPYWQEFKIPYKPSHNVVSALMVIRETPVTADGQKVEPVAWECNCMEEVCGACAMLINGKPMPEVRGISLGQTRTQFWALPQSLRPPSPMIV